MIVWGAGVFNTKKDPDTVQNNWTATKVTAPEGRALHSAVWTGAEMIVWGGAYFDPTYQVLIPLNSGGRYTPVTDEWTATNFTNAPRSAIHSLGNLDRPRNDRG